MAAQLELLRIVKALVKQPSSELQGALCGALRRLAEMVGSKRIWVWRRELTGRFHLLGSEPKVRLEWELSAEQADAVWLNVDRSALESCPSTLRSLLDALEIDHAFVLHIRESGARRGFLVLDTEPASPQERDRVEAVGDLIFDLLDRQGKESRLREQERCFVAASQSLPEQLIELDSKGLTTGVSANMTAGISLLHPTAFSGAGRSISEVLPGALADIVQEAWQISLAEGRAPSTRNHIRISNGTRIIEVAGLRRDDPVHHDLPPTVLIQMRDVTRREHMREELLRLDSVMNAMSNLVIMVDTDQRIQWVNSAFERQTGWMLSEVRGEILADVVRCPESDPDVIEGVARALRDVRPYSGEIINRDRDGNRYWVDFNVVPYSAADGTHAGFVSVETVVTRLKEQERATIAMAKAAAAAQARLENAINAMPNGALIFDSQERLVMRNEGFNELYPQLSHVAVPGALLVDLLRAGGRLGALLPAYATGSFESWIRSELAIYRSKRDERETERADGRWIHRVSNRTADGGLIIISSDITAKHMHRRAMDAAHAELTQALAERDHARNRLLNIIEGAQVGTWEVDVKARTLNFGGHWADILGRADDETSQLSTDEFASLIHPEDFDDILTIYRKGTPNDLFELEVRMLHTEGHWVWILMRGRVTQRSPEGVPLHFVGVNIDICERKRLEQEVRDREQHLTAAMDSSVAAIALVDDKDQLIYTNMEADRILQMSTGRRGRRPDEPMHWLLETVEGEPLSPEDHPVRMARDSGITVRDVLVGVRWQDGSRRLLTCNASPLDAEDGGSHIVTSFWDITDQLAATERLEQALAHAEEMSQAKSVFLANMSHEIRTPLNGVLGMTEVLGMQLTDPEHRHMIDTIRDSGQTLLTVLNSILDMSKIEAGKMELEAVPFLLQPIINQIEAVYTVQAEEKGIEFEVMVSSDIDLPRVGDPHRIQQILHNLLSNAVKFTSSGHVQLQVSCRRGKPVVFKITDTGPGMTPEQTARVFDSFEQADGSTTRKFGGTGLGLSIVRQLITLMGGKIRLESKVDRGTMIAVELPLQEGGLPAPRHEMSEQAVDDQIGALRILSADDSPTNREVMAQMLARTGVTLHQAENGRQAVDFWIAAREVGLPFDVVLLDVTMPELDGPSALAEIRAVERNLALDPVKVIAVTANAMPEQVAEYLSGGFDGYLAKPFVRKDLLQVIRGAKDFV